MLEKIKNDPLYQDLNWRLVLIGIVSSLGAMGFGFDNGWWAGALGLSEFQRKYGEYDEAQGRYALPSEKTSVGTGTGSAGIILGCVIAPIITSRLGRKKSFLVMSGLMSVGIMLEASAVTSYWQLVAGRIIVYSGIGLASNCVPMYLSETSPGRIRGRSKRPCMSVTANTPRCIPRFVQLLQLSRCVPGFSRRVPLQEPHRQVAVLVRTP